MPKDPPAFADIAKLLTPEVFADARKKALLFARSRTRSVDMAREAVDAAVAASLEGETRWDPRVEPSFARHLVKLVMNAFPNELRKAQRRREPEWKAAAAERTIPRTQTPEEIVGDVEERAEAGRFLDRVAGDLREAGHDLAASVLLLWKDGVDEPDDQAEHLGVPKPKVYRARELVREHIDKRKEREAKP